MYRNRNSSVLFSARKKMRAGVGAKQLHVDHVRDPRQRMPIRLIHVRKGPLNAGPRQTAENVRIVRDVAGIVVIDERVSANLCVDREDQEKKPADDQRALKSPGGNRQRSRFFRGGARTRSLLTTG